MWREEDVQCWPDTGVKPIIGSLLIIYINCEHWSPGTWGHAYKNWGQVGFNVLGILQSVSRTAMEKDIF